MNNNELKENCKESIEEKVNNDEILEKNESNIEKTTIIEINPNPENITEEEVKNIGADEKDI